jgi:hypothetical protein
MPNSLSPDLPSSICIPPLTQPDGEGIRSNDHARSPTPDTASTVSEGVDPNQRDNRFYIPFDLRIFHPNTLFTTHESLERERAGTSANTVDPSEELRQALELERWICYWLSMRLRNAEHRERELQEANARLRKRVEESERDYEALREQLNIIAIEVAEIERSGITSGSFSLLRGVLRSRMVSRVSRAIRRAPSLLANSEMISERG